MNGRALLGLGFLALVALWAGYLLRDVPGARTLAIRLADHATGRMESLLVRFDAPPDLKPGDPVYTVEDQAFALQGRVREVAGDRPAEVRIDLDPALRRRLSGDTLAVAMTPGSDLAWVLRTLVPPDLREKYLARLKAIWEERRGETLELLGPVLLQTLRDVGVVLRDSLPAAIAAHREEGLRVMEILKSEIYEAELEPVLEREVQARLEARLVPLAGQLGSEIWSAVSLGDLMSLSWVATKDMVGAAKNDEMSRKLGEILQAKALPVIRRKAPEMLAEAIDATREGMATEEVKQALVRAAKIAASHPLAQQWLQDFFETWIVENPAIPRMLQATLRSDEFRAPLEKLWKSAEPTLEDALGEILTRPEGDGMAHQLVRVLRHVVLKKDERYLLLAPGGGAALRDGDALSGTVGRDP